MTPTLALGLPQSYNHGLALKEAALVRRRRAIIGVIITALCLCVMITWHLVMQLPTSRSSGEVASPHRMLHQTNLTDVKQSHSLQYPKQLVDEHQHTVQDQRETRGFHDEKQIVMVLAHYQNSNACAQSLIDARAKAYLASRVHFRVFEELYLNQEPTCVQRYCELKSTDCKELLRSGQLRAQKRDASGALGFTVARYVAESLVERKFANDFYMSIDPAIVVFTEKWDIELLKQWYSVGNDMAILSIAPRAIESRNLSNATVLVQCSARIHSKSFDAVVEFNAPEPLPRQGAALYSPVLQTQYSELFHFGPIHALFDVRSDPHTPLILVGYEYARATRFWTRGYDFYAPNKDVVFARYQWKDAPFPKALGPTNGDIEQWRQRRSDTATRRIRRLLGLPVSVLDGQLEQFETYALGNLRSMDAWQRFSGVNPRAAYNESTTNQFSLCAAIANNQVQYVRYSLNKT
ncbi:Glycosyltransferase, GlcNAc [Plasmopara halstedii]|uniref:Glycosyltransferase, GlcNAc n=1 Tax=Plasmopara halstedii TaxID=4781 RepID=A0A0P1AG76_PLAHL|nr:Glycosyltransferase, GlcNAc [Plasmopara halstedii]CEG39642.1 Glycosyltransferase, GlcNAc [Plasmopara halstedii]|eukprot:XP_024576011.1 Glycosyltransferase, GlcNAc [Plasmopara halstedii]